MTRSEEKNEQMNIMANGEAHGMPDTTASVSQLFGFESNMIVPSYAVATEHVPDLDEDYLFNRDTTLAILAGFAFNRRVMITGYHGTGKSTHIEQVAARLNWPCIRINLDSHISRIDLIGKDAIVLQDGKQITEFREGILPWAYQRNVALVFDEYDAGRPDVMFVIQRILESSGKLTLLDQSKVIRPHKAFRLFSTANTVGLGDADREPLASGRGGHIGLEDHVSARDRDRERLAGWVGPAEDTGKRERRGADLERDINRDHSERDRNDQRGGAVRRYGHAAGGCRVAGR